MNLDENYFKDNFTKEGEKVNLEINKLKVECIESQNNKFNLDRDGNLRVNSITTIEPITSIVDIVYPIGSIYMNVSAINPNKILGGSWEQIKDVFLLASGNVFPNSTVGGEVMHTLTINEIPSHTHPMRMNWGDATGNVVFSSGKDFTLSVDQGNSFTYPNGLSEPHNNMPPYFTVCVWKRVA